MKTNNQKKSTRRPMRSTNRNTRMAVPPKKGNWIWWVAGIGGGLAMWIIFSSFKSDNQQGNGNTETPPINDGSETVQPLTQCINDWGCKRGYWAWQILRSTAGRKVNADKAKASGKTNLEQALITAETYISDPNRTYADMSIWETTVSKKMDEIRGNAQWMANVQQKANNKKLSVEKQIRDDATMSIIEVLAKIEVPILTATNTGSNGNNQGNMNGFGEINLI